jgi:phosphonate transport system substrate-binding protein
MHRILRIVALALALSAGLASLAQAKPDWAQKYPEVTLGVVTSENEADRTIRYKPVQEYFEKRFGIKINWRTATDYAGIIEGVKAGKIQLAYFGPASYAKCYIVTGGKVEPLAGALDEEGKLGYYSVVAVRKDSPYQSVKDLKGVKFAFADPNSTSGFQAPSFFLTEQGYKPDEFFGSCTFSGSHENSVMGLVNGTYDAVATSYKSENSSNLTRMESKGMIPPGQCRVIWKSPLLPSSPWAMPTDLPEAMRKDFQKAIIDMPTASPEAWKGWSAGMKDTGFVAVTHADYEPVVRMIQSNLKERRGS